MTPLSVPLRLVPLATMTPLAVPLRLVPLATMTLLAVPRTWRRLPVIGRTQRGSGSGVSWPWYLPGRVPPVQHLGRWKANCVGVAMQVSQRPLGVQRSSRLHTTEC
jgi:hypothetical protein